MTNAMTIASPLPQQLALAAPPVGGSATGPNAPAAASGTDFQAFGDDGFTFFDFLDIVNPLQHIPFVATLYREVTGDAIDPGSRIAGGTLFGGPVGAAVAVANVAIEHTTGKDMGAHMIALLEGDEAGDSTEPEEGFAVETADRGVRGHIEVRQWAEREAAFHAAQAAARLAAPRQQQAGLPQRDPVAVTAKPRTGARPTGAIAGGGGWFSDTMLSALTRYQETQRIADLVADKQSP